MMPIYVVEIAKRAVVAFDARFGTEAQQFANCSVFRSSLAMLESDGEILWDGETQLSVRLACPEERDKWIGSIEKAEFPDRLEDSTGKRLVFLVPIDDPTDGYC